MESSWAPVVGKAEVEAVVVVFERIGVVVVAVEQFEVAG